MVNAASGVEVLLTGKRPSVLVLGSRGMLGQTVFQHLSECGWAVTGTQSSDLDAREDPEMWQSLFAGCDYAINCIGILKNAIGVDDAVFTRVNGVFPHLVAKAAAAHGTKVIHMSTDGVFAGRGERPYVESDRPDAADLYGRSKAQGECADSCVLNIRCSIVGRDRTRHKGLLEWLLAQPDGGEVQGYTNQLWNGVTTLQFARLCKRIIEQEAFEKTRADSHVHHFCPNPATTKYDLLKTWCAVTRKELTVNPAEGPLGQSRLLASEYPSLSGLLTPAMEWRQILSELT